MNMPSFSAHLSLSGPEGVISAATESAPSPRIIQDVLCVPWYCCEEQAGCGWNCQICVVRVPAGVSWLKITTRP
jgi:hypothetical protein